MNDVIRRACGFATTVHPSKARIYRHLADRQMPSVLVIGCADSRVAPEHVLAAEPGELFVCRTAGNIVPPAGSGEGVACTVEYGLTALPLTDIVVCGHHGCGAMSALASGSLPDDLPNVKSWLEHARRALDAAPGGADDERVRRVSLENIKVQLDNLRTHAKVQAKLAAGALTLHGWYLDFKSGEILALDGRSGDFVAVDWGRALPVAQSGGFAQLEAAE